METHRKLNKIKEFKYNNKAVTVISAVSIIIGLILWIIIIIGFNQAQYELRPLAFLPLFATVVNLGLILFLYKKIQSSETGFWFLAFIGSLAMWSFTEFMQRSSSTLALSMDWRLPAVFSWSIMPVLYLFFALSYVDKQSYIRRLHFQLGAFLVVSGLIYAQFTTNLVIRDNYKINPWGYDSTNGPFLSIFGLWLIAIFLTALYLFVQEYKISFSHERRKQVRIFMIGVSIPLIGGVFTDIILPFAGFNALPMAAFLTSLQGFVLGYGIYRHGLFNINPESLSNEIMTTLPQPVIATDAQYHVQFMNANAREMFKQYEPILGKSIHHLIGDENFKAVESAVSKASRGEVINIERMPLGLEQGVVIAQAKINSIAEGRGYIFGLSNITQQVLSMKIIEKEVAIRTELYNHERARLLASVNGLRQGFLIADGGHKVVLMNTKAQEMFPDIKISKSQGGSVVDTNAIDLLERHLEGFNLEEKLKLVVEKSQYIEVEGVDIADSIFDIEILPIGVDDGAIGAVVLFDDVTERTIVQRSKDEFFSIASHELRTPLTAIRGNTSMILSYYEEQIKDPELKEMVSDIHDSSLRLIEIVNDFLDTSRLEQGKMVFNIEAISLTKIIEEVVKETKIVAEEKGNKVIFESPKKELPMVSADMNKLKQVIYNVVGNALKFTENGTVKIKPEIQKTSIKVSIIDTGRGISEESKTLLFRKFQQASSSLITRDTTKGTGLGLYISKLILENMDGSIGIDSSEVGVGSTFYFTIPITDRNREKITN